MCSHAFVSGCDYHDQFKKVLNRIIGNNNAMKLDEETINSHELSRFYGWSNVYAENHTEVTNMTLLAKLKRETSSCYPHSYGRVGVTRFNALAVFAFFEFLFLIRNLVFSPTSGVLVHVSDTPLFKDMKDQDGVTVVNPTDLVVLIATDDHMDKTVMNPKLGAWTQGIIMIPAWTTESVMRMDSAKKSTEAELVKNWDDHGNEILLFYPNSDEGSKFKKSK